MVKYMRYPAAVTNIPDLVPSVKKYLRASHEPPLDCRSPSCPLLHTYLHTSLARGAQHARAKRVRASPLSQMNAEALNNVRHYQSLGLKRTDATPEEIKRGYHDMSRKTHPDRNQDDPDSTSKFQE